MQEMNETELKHFKKSLNKYYGINIPDERQTSKMTRIENIEVVINIFDLDSALVDLNILLDDDRTETKRLNTDDRKVLDSVLTNLLNLMQQVRNQITPSLFSEILSH